MIERALLLAHESVDGLLQVALWLLVALGVAILVALIANIVTLRRSRVVAASSGESVGTSSFLSSSGESQPAIGFDRAGRAISATREIAALLDADAAALVAPGVLDARVHPRDRATWDKAAAARAAGSATTIEFQCRMQRSDGTWRWLHVVQRAVDRAPNDDPALPRFVATLVDFTDRRVAEDRATRLAEILRTSSSVLAMLGGDVDRGTALRRAIEAVARTLRTERAAFCAVEPEVDRASFEFEWIDPGAEGVASVLAQRQLLPPHAVIWWLEAFGSGRPVVIERDAATLADPVKSARIPPDAQSLLVVPVVARTRVRGAITFEHVRERRPFSSEELGLAQTLSFAAARAIERGLDAERDVRIEAMERRMGRTELLAQLAASVGPDLRDALFALSGSAGEMTVDAKRGVDDVRDMVLALGETSETEPTEPQDVPLAPEIATAIGLARRLLPSSFRIESDPEAIESIVVRATRSSVQRLLVSLVTAARESAGRDGRVRIAARVERGERRRGRSAICIEDDGPPPIASVRPKILDAFGAANASPTEVLDAIARRAALDCGGSLEIDASSALGGRRVVVRLPLAGDESTLTSPAAPGERLADVGRVLIIDADAAVRAVLADAFTALDVEVEVRDYANGADRAVLDGPLRYDLVVVDIDLPGGAGTAFLDRLRRGGSLVPALVMTDGRSDIHSSLAPLRVLRKPFGLDTMLREARAVVDDARAWTRA